ncbi:MAG TPA: RDD family protein [Candidatus Limnocylindria bacterium]
MTEVPEPPRNPATVRRRLVAYVIDCLLVAIIGFGVAALVSAVAGAALTVEAPADGLTELVLDPARFALQAAAVTVASALYFTAGWSGPWLATLGQRAVRVQVIDADVGGPLGAPRAVGRWLALGAPLGLLAALVVQSAPLWLLVVAIGAAWSVVLLVSSWRNARRRGLHDRLVGSVVVHRPA